MSDKDSSKNTSSLDNIKWVSTLISQKRSFARPVDDGVIGEEGAKERDGKYTKLLVTYSEKYAEDKSIVNNQKKTFFKAVLAMFIILLLAGIAILFLALFFDKQSSIAVVIGASVDILGTFIAIPTIIAKHLFPEKMDNGIIEVVKLLVQNDEHVREIKEKHFNKDIK